MALCMRVSRPSTMCIRRTWPGGRLVFQTNIPRIKIDGEKAVVDLIYTGFLNTESAEAPKPYEQGHDHMELRDAEVAGKSAAERCGHSA